MPDSLWLHRLQSTRFLCPWDFPGKDTGVGCHFLLQGIFLIQALNLCLLHLQVDSLPLSHLGRPQVLTNYTLFFDWDFPGGSDCKASAYNAGDRVQILDQKDLLETKMAPHSSILVWKIPWTEEPGKLQPMGSQRVRYDWATSLSLSTLFFNHSYPI